jgi:hypothetical protein
MVEVQLQELEVVDMAVMAVVEVVAVMVSGFVVDYKGYYFVEGGKPLSSIIIMRGRGSMEVHIKGWPHGGREGHCQSLACAPKRESQISFTILQ